MSQPFSLLSNPHYNYPHFTNEETEIPNAYWGPIVLPFLPFHCQVTIAELGTWLPG